MLGMKTLILALFFVAADLAPTPPGTDQIMDRIEAAVTMPAGASPLPVYDRYYAWEERDDGVRKVLGTYVRGERPQRHWVRQNDLPLVLDGGCDIVTLTYDVDADRIERVECNSDG